MKFQNFIIGIMKFQNFIIIIKEVQKNNLLNKNITQIRNEHRIMDARSKL